MLNSSCAFDVQVVADVAFARSAVLTSRKKPSPWPPVLPEAEAQPVGDRAGDASRRRSACRSCRRPRATSPCQVSVGRFEITLIAPPIELRPYSVPCGPRSTSMRSVMNRALAGFDVARGVEAVGVRRDAGIGAVVVGEAADAAQAHAIERGRIRQARA